VDSEKYQEENQVASSPEEAVPFETTHDKAIDLTEAKKRVIEALENASSQRKSIVDASLNMNYEDIWNEEIAARYAISTSSKKDSEIADYYDPKLYRAATRVVTRVRNAPFEGMDDNFYDMEPVDYDEDHPETDEEANSKTELSVQKAVLNCELKRSRFKKWIKDLITDGYFMDAAIGKIVPSTDSSTIKYWSKKANGSLVIKEKVVKKESLKLVNLDINNFYVEDIFENDVQKNNNVEIYESDIHTLKALEAEGIYQNTDQIQVGIFSNILSPVYNFKTSKRELAVRESKTLGKVMIAEYWGSMIVGGKSRKVNIVLANNVVIKAIFLPYWMDKYPYIKWCYEEIKDSFYGISYTRRHLRSQWALNQVYNMDIQNSLLKMSGATFIRSDAGEYVEQQIPDGKIRLGQQIKIDTGDSIKDVMAPIQFPDIQRTAEHLTNRITDTIESGMGSNAMLDGQPTHTQLDRTGVGYGAALAESKVDIKDAIYSIQDDLIEPAITMFWQLFYETNDANRVIMIPTKMGAKTVNVPVTISPSDINSMVKIKVFGGSKFLENERHVQDLAQAMQFMQSSPEVAKQINYAEIMKMYFEYKGMPGHRIAKQKDPEDMFMELLAYMPVEQILQYAATVLQAKKQKEAEEAQGKLHKAKQDFVNEVNLDRSYDEAQGALMEKEAATSAAEGSSILDNEVTRNLGAGGQ